MQKPAQFALASSYTKCAGPGQICSLGTQPQSIAFKPINIPTTVPAGTLWHGMTQTQIRNLAIIHYRYLTGDVKCDYTSLAAGMTPGSDIYKNSVDPSIQYECYTTPIIADPNFASKYIATEFHGAKNDLDKCVNNIGQDSNFCTPPTQLHANQESIIYYVNNKNVDQKNNTVKFDMAVMKPGGECDSLVFGTSLQTDPNQAENTNGDQFKCYIQGLQQFPPVVNPTPIVLPTTPIVAGTTTPTTGIATPTTPENIGMAGTPNAPPSSTMSTATIILIVIIGLIFLISAILLIVYLAKKNKTASIAKAATGTE